MQPQAYLIARDFLSREELEMYDELFDMVPRDISKNKVYAEAHKTLLGEDILITKKKLRNLKRKKKKEAVRAQKRLERQNKAMRKKAVKERLEEKFPTESMFIKKVEPKDDVSKFSSKATSSATRHGHVPMSSPTLSQTTSTNLTCKTQDTSKLSKITLEEYGYESRKNCLFIPSINSFLKVKKHFETQSHLGFDSEFKGTALSLICIASSSLVAVFDVFSLIAYPEFIDFLKFILMESRINVIGHSLKTDQYVINYNFK